MPLAHRYLPRFVVKDAGFNDWFCKSWGHTFLLCTTSFPSRVIVRV